MNIAYSYAEFPALATHKTWAEIDTGALRYNFRQLRDSLCADGCTPIAVVKADAYGHGALPCVQALMEEGCGFFAVSCIEEAIAIRGVCPPEKGEILILGYTLPEEAALLAQYRLIQTVFSADYAAALAAAAASADVCLRVHVKLDTGMNRLGFSTLPDALAQTVEDICALAGDEHFTLCGLYTHFARADEADEAPIAAQYARYEAVRDALTERGVDVGMRHVCNSAAACRTDRYHLDAVRLGIVLYGVVPSGACAPLMPVSLRPVMRLCTCIAHIHELAPGEPVGYGGCWQADTPRRIATLPVGYADGFMRAFRGARVSIATAAGVQEADVVGNICMDQCMLDVTGLDAAVGDVVTLFGDAPGRLSALAERAGTIDYEPLCLITGRVPRLYV